MTPRRAPSITALVALLLASAVFHACTERSGTPDPAPQPGQSADGAPRLVVLSPAFAVILRDLGHHHLIVARHAFDEVLPSTIPVAGDENALDYEVIITARPTDIILAAAAGDPPDRLSALARDRQWTVHEIPALTLDEIPRAVRALDAIATDADPASPPSADAIRITNRFNHALRPRDTKAFRVMLIMQTDPVAILGPGSAHFQIAQRIGLHPVPESGNPFQVISAEDVIAARPDAIVLLMPNADNSRVDELLGPLAHLRLPAITENRVALLNDPSTLWPATTLSRYADSLAGAAITWAEPDAD